MTGLPGVLINAANLRVGGGIQVAASFLDELAAMRADPGVVTRHPWLRDGLEVVASPLVAENCTRAQSLPLTVRPTTVDFKAPFRRRYDVSFTVFGPEYVPINARRRIVGFADVTSLYPEFLAPTQDARTKARQIARRVASKLSFRSPSAIIVEAEHIGRDLQESWGLPASKITVVPNSYNRVFDDPEAWAPIEVPRRPGVSNVCFVTRGYPHKNLAILGQVGDTLERRGVAVRFVLTLRDDEWSDLPELTRRHSVSVGEVTVPQLPNLYAACEASIFPSLLEAFSVAPLEALVTGTPLVASDRDFVRPICGDVPWYADPTDPVALATALAEALSVGAGGDRVRRGVVHARLLPAAADRARAYVELIGSALCPR